MRLRIRTRNLALLLTLMITRPAWPAKSSTLPDLPDPGRAHMSKDKQEQLGLRTAAEVYKQMPVLPDANPVSQYVQQLGRKLSTVVPPQY